MTPRLDGVIREEGGVISIQFNEEENSENVVKVEEGRVTIDFNKDKEAENDKRPKSDIWASETVPDISDDDDDNLSRWEIFEIWRIQNIFAKHLRLVEKTS